MSNSDLPPSCDTLHVPIYNPLIGYFPEAPAYTPPAHEDQAQRARDLINPGTLPSGPQPPQPSTPHTVQPAGRGPDPEHLIPGMPYTVPPLAAPPPHLSSGDCQVCAATGVWDSTAARHAFIQKVYLIVTAQLLIMSSIVAIFTFVEAVRLFVVRNPAVYWSSCSIFFVCYIVLACCGRQRRRFPLNIIFLVIFTLALSYLAGTMSSHYNTKAVFLSFGLTVVVTLTVTAFCLQTKVDLTQYKGLFSILSLVLMALGAISVFALSFQYIEWVSLLYSAVGTIVFTLFLALHTQYLLRSHSLGLSPGECIFAVLSIYLDIIQVFMFILEFSSQASN